MKEDGHLHGVMRGWRAAAEQQIEGQRGVIEEKQQLQQQQQQKQQQQKQQQQQQQQKQLLQRSHGVDDGRSGEFAEQELLTVLAPRNSAIKLLLLMMMMMMIMLIMMIMIMLLLILLKLDCLQT